MLRVSVALICQWLEPQPAVAETGAEVEIVARDAGGHPIAELAITAIDPAGVEIPIGSTGVDGTVHFEPAAAGSYRIRARHDGVVLATPLTAVAPRRRWLYAVFVVPIGLLLAWRGLRPRGPSRPVP